MSTKNLLCVFVTQAKGPVQVVSERVRLYRRWRGWSARELADRCQAAGLTWNRAIIQNLELGKRAIVSIDELLVLAHVLSVPVLALFIPLGDTQQFRVTPTLTVDPYVAQLWIDGHLPRVDQGLSTSPHPDTEDARTWSRAKQPLTLFNRLYAAALSFETSSEDLAKAEKADDNAWIDHARRTRLADLRSVAEALDEVRGNGLVPPRLPAPLMQALAAEINPSRIGKEGDDDVGG